jgi:hypothetical protein
VAGFGYRTAGQCSKPVQLPAGQEKLRVHRRFFKDSQIADSQIADSEAAPA